MAESIEDQYELENKLGCHVNYNLNLEIGKPINYLIGTGKPLNYFIAIWLGRPADLKGIDTLI